jgi:hypothetical protein
MSRIRSSLPFLLVVTVAGCSQSAPSRTSTEPQVTSAKQPAASPRSTTVDAREAAEPPPPIDPASCNVRHQLERLGPQDPQHQLEWIPAYERLTAEWKTCIQSRIDTGEIRVDMPRAALLDILGEPTDVWAGESQENLRWYFDTPMHVNPAFDVQLEGGRVASWRFLRA